MKPRPLSGSAAREGPFDRLCLGLGRAAILAVIVLLPLAIAEGAARLLHAPEPIRRVYDPYAYRIPQPLLVDTFQTTPGETLDSEPVTVRLNELGMRGPRLDEPTPADGLTLVFLGGSTTENYKFPRTETFPELIGQRVAAELGRPVRVFNAGMSAGTTATSLARLQHQVLDLEPSLIVVMHSINDLIFGFHPEYRPDGRHLTRP
ncbi:MAG: GDSL-type esterase/lipase family protein, partial [Acidobacteriota bacterium]